MRDADMDVRAEWSVSDEQNRQEVKTAASWPYIKFGNEVEYSSISRFATAYASSMGFSHLLPTYR
jgi:hypothetical protein